MAVFPPLEPDTRAFDFGDFPMSRAGGIGGGEVRFNHADEATGHGLTLSFLDRSDAELESIREHYRGQDGGHVSFTLPAIIWQGHGDDFALVSSAGRWKYTGPPEEVHKRGGIHDVTVSLEYVGASLAS